MVSWQMALAGPRTAEATVEGAGEQGCLRPVTRTTAGEPAMWVCSVHTAPRSLGFCWGLTASYLDPKAPAKALLSIGGFCPLLLLWGDRSGGPPTAPPC